MDIFTIRDAERLQIISHAEEEYPVESCGVLIGKSDGRLVTEIVRAGNSDVEDIKDVHYAIAPLELHRIEQEAEKKGLEVIGFYHSHTDCPAIPSYEDERLMIPGCMYVIVSVVKGECVDMRCYLKASFDGELYIIGD